MDTNPTTDLYHRYKIGTKHVVQWLADTARQTADLASILPSVKPSASPAEERNKAKKKKRATKRHEVSNLTVSTQDLKRLSNAIASAATSRKPAPDGIETTIAVLQDVIAGRSECSLWYGNRVRQDDVAASESDRSHCHFVDTLREVLEALQRTQRLSRPSTSKARECQSKLAPKTANETLANVFASLSVQEPTPAGMEETAHPNVNIKHTITKAVRCELKQSKEDATFALWCVLRQCHEIRIFIKELWRAWRGGDMSLLTAGEVTDKAFMVIHSAFSELNAEFPELSTFDDVSEKLKIRTTLVNGEMDGFSCDVGSLKSSNMADTTADQLLCVPALSCLSVMRAYLREIGREDVNLTQAEGIMSHIQTGHRLGRTIMLVFPELFELQCRDGLAKDFMSCDVFVRDVLSFFATRRLELPFVIEFQIYMDIYDQTETTGGKPYWVARRYTDNIKNVYQTHADFAEELGDIPELANGFLRSSAAGGLIMRHIKQAIETPIIRRSQAILHHAEGDDCDESYVSLLLIAFPVMTGVLLSLLANMRYSDGVETCNDGAVVLATAHLYRACRNSGALEKPWEDMEYIIAQHGAQALGLRNTIKSAPALAAAKHFGLAFGVELREYGDRAREMVRAKIRGISRVPLPAKMTPAVQKRCASMTVSDPYMQLLSENAVKCKSLGTTALQAVNSTLHQLARKLLSKDSRSLLTVFKSALLAGERTIHFNHHLFYAQCAVLLGEVKKGTMTSLRGDHRWHGFAKPDEGTQLHQMVDEILWKGAEEELLPRESYPHPEHLALTYSSIYFSEIIDSGKGDQYTKNAGQLSSGTLAECLKPHEDDEEDPLNLRRMPKHILNAKATIRGTDIMLTQPDHDPRWVEWRSRMDEVERIVEARGGDVLARDERRKLAKRVMEELGVKMWYADDEKGS